MEDFIIRAAGYRASLELRQIEAAKIHCARAHFRALGGAGVIYDAVGSYAALLDIVTR